VEPACCWQKRPHTTLTAEGPLKLSTIAKTAVRTIDVPKWSIAHVIAEKAPAAAWEPENCFVLYISARRSLRALPITDTELKLIAAAAIIGDTRGTVLVTIDPVSGSGTVVGSLGFPERDP
jgi:hypothetical protein